MLSFWNRKNQCMSFHTNREHGFWLDLPPARPKVFVSFTGRRESWQQPTLESLWYIYGCFIYFLVRFLCLFFFLLFLFPLSRIFSFLVTPVKTHKKFQLLKMLLLATWLHMYDEWSSTKLIDRGNQETDLRQLMYFFFLFD